MRPAPAPTHSALRRRRRLIGALPALLASWVVVAALPLGSPAPELGSLHTQTFILSGDPTSTAGASSTYDRAVTRSANSVGAVTLDLDDPSQAVAVTWTGTPDGRVEVRGRTGDAWSGWTEIHADTTEVPDRTGAAAEGPAVAVNGDLVWFGGAGVTQVQVKVASGPLENLKVEATRYEAPGRGKPVPALLGARPAGAADTTPAIRPRSEWAKAGWAYENDDCESGPKLADGGVKFAVVHHTVNSNTYGESEVPGMLAAIYRFHTESRGWCDIAYNFVIDRFGRIWEARTGSIAGAVIGGHAQGFNTNSVGVSFLGQHNSGDTPTAVAPTAAQLEAAGSVIGWKLGTNGSPATGTVTAPNGTTIERIVGHRDVGSTSCPGGLLWDKLATIRTKAASVASKTTPTTPPTTIAPTTTTSGPSGPSKPLGPFASAAELVDQSYQDVLRRKPNANEHNLATAAVSNGLKAEDFLANLVTGTEADSMVRQPARLYRAYFLRNPDHDGLEFWVSRRRAGWSLDRISNEFAASAEFTKRYGSLTSGQFVDLVYRNVMGRAPDQAGRVFWEGRLAAGTSRGKVMTGFSESPEYRTKTEAGISVVVLYDAMIRATIPQGTYDYLEPRLRNGTTSTAGVARYFMDKPEYNARFK